LDSEGLRAIHGEDLPDVRRVAASATRAGLVRAALRHTGWPPGASPRLLGVEIRDNG